MKKIATIVMLIVVMTMLSFPALASQPGYPINSEFDQYDTDQKFSEWEKRISERGTAFWYKGHGILLTWYIESLDNHQNVFARYLPNKAEVYALHTDRIDFIEFGKLYQAESEDEIETVKQAFEKNSVDAALKFIFPVEAKLTPRDIETGDTWAIMEMLASGTTQVADMYDFPFAGALAYAKQ